MHIIKYKRHANRVAVKKAFPWNPAGSAGPAIIAIVEMEKDAGAVQHPLTAERGPVLITVDRGLVVGSKLHSTAPRVPQSHSPSPRFSPPRILNTTTQPLHDSAVLNAAARALL